MKATSFEYKGYTFKPIGNILGGFKVKSGYMTWAYTLKIEGYTHKDFYRVAKKHHASCDIFECDGKLYIPCDTTLAGIYNNPPIKKVEEYERWYQ